MKKNLILFIIISLVAVSLVSAAPWSGWFNGNAVESGNRNTANLGEGQISMFEGEIREIGGHVVTIISIGDSSSMIDVDGTSQEINEGSSGIINGFQITLVNTFESWWRRNNVVLETGASGREVNPGTPITPVNHTLNGSIITPVEGEVTYAGVLSMLRSAEIVTSSGNGETGRSCDELCSGQEKVCIASARTRFEGNFTAAPHYFEPTVCSAQQSTFQFRLYCSCISLDTSVNQVAGGWGCIECSSPGQCGTYGTCLSSGCCGGTAPQGVTDQVMSGGECQFGISCSSDADCGTSQCLSSGCCGGTAPSGLTDGQTN